MMRKQYVCRLSSFCNNLGNCPKKVDSGLGPNQTRPDDKNLLGRPFPSEARADGGVFVFVATWVGR